MSTGMLGANTDELRALAGVFQQKSDDVANAKSTTVPEVEGVDWQGPDADAFRARYSGDVAPSIADLAERLRQVKDDLERQAQEQDDCSNPKGGGAGGQGGSGNGNGFSLFNYLKDVYKKWNQFRKPGQFARFLMESAALLRSGDLLKEMLTSSRLNWSAFTGRLPGAGKQLVEILEATGLESRAASMFGPLYKNMKSYTDFLGANGISSRLEGMLPDGWAKNLENFTGKPGRALARGLGAFGVVFDGVETIQSIGNGNLYGEGQGGLTKSAAWNGAQTVLAATSFVPGPVGWVSAGVSAGMAVYENREAIGNAMKGLVTDPVGTVSDGVKGVVSALNPFD